MTARRLKVAIVGASMSGNSAEHNRFAVSAHLPVLKALPEHYEVVATCTTRIETATAAARHFQVPHAYDSVERMLDELPDLDVVCVSVRPAEQHPVVVAALRAGKHVYCEHPMGCTTGQAQEMHEVARQKNVRTVVGHEHHYEPGMLHLAELMRQGYIGKALTFNLVFFNSGLIIPPLRHWMMQSAMGGHPAWRTGHSLERVTSVIGDVSDICADMAVLSSQSSTPDNGASLCQDQVNNVSFLMRVGDNVMGSLQLSLTAWFGTGWDFQIYGTEGMLMLSARGGAESNHMKLYGARADRKLAMAKAGTPELLRGHPRQIPVPDRHRYVSGIAGGEINFLVAQVWYAFAAAINTGTECVPSFRDELKIHCVWEASEKSVRDRSWTKVDYSPLDSA